MYTVDASVWVNGFDHRESGHEISRRFLQNISSQVIPVYVPYLLLVEVAGAISRTRKDVVQAQIFVTALSQLSNVTFIELNESLAKSASWISAQHGLRGADAVYAAVAQQMNCSLITLDNEHLQRLGDVIVVQTPANVLATQNSLE